MRVVRRAAAVALAVDADEAARADQGRARAESGDAGERGTAGEAERDVLESGLRLCAFRARRPVVPELEFVDRPAPQDALQVEDRVRRIDRDFEEPSAEVLRIQAPGLI